MSDDLHAVVKLLLARMDSNPDEFAADLSVDGSRADRWWQVIRLILDSGTKEEKEAVNQGIRKIKLQRAHEMMMDELLNGDERRRREQEEQEYEANLLNTARNQRNMGASLRSALHPGVQQVDDQMQQDMRQRQTEAIKNAYNVLKRTITKAKTL